MCPGLRFVDISGCGNIDDAAFHYLVGVHTLVMNRCKQERISDAAFAHLRGIFSLSVLDNPMKVVALWPQDFEFVLCCVSGRCEVVIR